MTSTAVKRMRDEILSLQSAVQKLEQKPSNAARLNETVFRAMIEMGEKLLRAIEENTPFIANSVAYATELYAAMGLPWYPIALPITTSNIILEQQIQDCCKELDLPGDLCTAVRLAIYYIEADLCVPPSALVAVITPCDGMGLLNQMLVKNESWRDVPIFAPDPPYPDDDRALTYCTQEFRYMVSFLEEHTGRQLDLDRLRNILEETNRQYMLWSEFNELKRAVPCPWGYQMGNQVWLMVQMLWPGDPRCTTWLQEVVATTEQLVQEGKGAVATERIRLFWYDIRPLWMNEFASWLEDEWGAVIVIDMPTYNPYTLVDTSTEDNMLRGLARRALYEMPMVRQERGPVDHLISDITRIVIDYKIDCIIWPGHMGHKAMAGTVGIGKEISRQLGIPFLYLGVDLFDSTYTTLNEMKDKCSKFFTTVGLG